MSDDRTTEKLIREFVAAACECEVRDYLISEYAERIEQAIAATLGGNGEYEAKMDALLCRLTNGKWSKSRAYDLDFMEQCINEEFEMLYAKEPADVEHGNGTLTTEQVCEVIERHSAWVIGNNRCFHDGAYEAIADELNALMEKAAER